MFEHPSFEESKQEHIPSSREIRVHNLLEVMLMRKFISEHGVAPEETQKALDEWAATYAEPFSEAYTELITEKPELLEEWFEKPDSTSERIIGEIKPKLYREKAPIEKAA